MFLEYTADQFISTYSHQLSKNLNDVKLTECTFEKLQRIFNIIWSNKLTLDSLNLKNNNLTKLPLEISYLRTLKVLNLNNNSLESLPFTIVKLHNLKTLYLNHNKIVSLPKEITYLKYLKVLTLIDNPIQYLPNSFRKYKSLKSLDISSTNIKRVPHHAIISCDSIKTGADYNHQDIINKLKKQYKSYHNDYSIFQLIQKYYFSSLTLMKLIDKLTNKLLKKQIEEQSHNKGIDLKKDEVDEQRAISYKKIIDKYLIDDELKLLYNFSTLPIELKFLILKKKLEQSTVSFEKNNKLLNQLLEEPIESPRSRGLFVQESLKFAYEYMLRKDGIFTTLPSSESSMSISSDYSSKSALKF